MHEVDPAQADPFDPSVPVALDDRAPWFEWMVKKWPDEVTSDYCRATVHRMDVERAAQPPVVYVTVPGIPGHFSGQLGGPVAYAPDPALTGGFQALDSLA